MGNRCSPPQPNTNSRKNFVRPIFREACPSEHWVSPSAPPRTVVKTTLIRPSPKNTPGKGVTFARRKGIILGRLLTDAVRAAAVPDRNGTPAAVLRMLLEAPHVVKHWTDGGQQEPKSASELEKLGYGLMIIKKLKDVKRLAVLRRR